MLLKRILAVFTIVIIVTAIVMVKRKPLLTNEKTSHQFEQFHEGDLVFQTSQSAQSKAIQLATHSPYSHCGIVLKQNGALYVLEAIQPVKLTLLNDWIAKGKDHKFVVKRLKESARLLTPANLGKLKVEGREMLGKTYDLTFEWNDNQLYCSELVWKVYQRALNIEIGKLQKLSSFDLTDPIVTEITNKRYGKNIPLNEPVISPQAIFDSELLTTVTSNF